jgi:thioredoxin-related protein
MTSPCITTFFCIAILMLCTHCSLSKKQQEKLNINAPKDHPYGPTAIPPELRSGSQIASGGNVSPEIISAAIANITPQEDLIFTDPDNPEASLEEINSINAKKMPENTWQQSETIAKKLAFSQGKPLLIWFNQSANNPICLQIQNELFSSKEFSTWAKENTIRLLIDQNVTLEDSKLSMDEKYSKIYAIQNYNKALAKKYDVIAYPSILMLKPNGEVILRHRKYKSGNARFLLGTLQNAADIVKREHEQWKIKMTQQGYREWENQEGKKYFGKLLHVKDNIATFTEPDGTISKTHIDNLNNHSKQYLNL